VFSRSVAVSDSSTVAKIDFDPITETMMVTFHTGARYVYSPVTAGQFGLVAGGESVGKMMNIIIKEDDNISFTKVD
jgi:hypothetical protein